MTCLAGDVVQRVVGVVDLAVHAEGLGQVGDLHQAGDAALDDDVAAQEVGGAAGDPGREGGEAARVDLGGEQRDAQVPAEADVVVHVVGGERVLEPVVAEVLDRLADLEAFGVGIGPRGVEHQRHAVADRFPDGRAGLDVEVDRGRGSLQPRAARRVQLVALPALCLPVGGFLGVLGRGLVVGGGEVGGDAVAAGAEQAVDRQAGGLPRDVPERDVDRADGMRRQVVDEVLQPPPVPADVERVFAEQPGLDDGDDLLGDLRRAGARVGQEGVALDALVGLDPQHPEGHGPGRPEAGGGGVPAFVEDDGDIGDAHGPDVTRLTA